MFDKYYNMLKKKLISLKKDGMLGSISVSDVFIDPNVDMLMHLFATASVDSLEKINRSQIDVNNNLLRSFCSFLFQIKPSCSIFSINLINSCERFSIKAGSDFFVKDSNSDIRYVNQYDENIINISYKSFFSTCDELNLNSSLGSYFISVSLESSFYLKDLLSKPLKVFISGPESSNICKQFLKSKIVYGLVNGKAISLGNIYQCPPDSFLKKDFSTPRHLDYLISYFTFPHLFNFFYLNLENIPDNLKEILLLIPSSMHIESNNFFNFNSIPVANQFLTKSNSFTFSSITNNIVYIDYEQRNSLAINEALNLIAVNKLNGDVKTVQCYGSLSKISSNKFENLEAIIYSGIGKDDSWKTTLSFQFYEKGIIDEVLDNYVFYINVIACNIINVRPRSDKIFSSFSSEILSSKALISPSVSIIPKDIDELVPSRIFYLSMQDLIHSPLRREYIVEIFRSIVILLGNRFDIEALVDNIEISDSIRAICQDGKYLVNVVIYNIKIYIKDSLLTTVDYRFLYLLDLIFTNLLSFGSLFEFKIVTSKEEIEVYRKTTLK